MTRSPLDGPLLVIDTSGDIGSVAVAHRGTVVADARLERRAEHAARLVPAVDEVLRAGGVRVGDLTAIAVGSGPGSFTGVRVAAATAKGLAHALDTPVWAVSSLAGAALAPDGEGRRYALFDARSDRVYGAAYDVGPERVTETRAPHGGVVADVIDASPPADTTFLGDGAERHRAELEAAGFEVIRPRSEETIARGIVRYLALAQDPLRVEDVHAWEPTYIRDSGAVPTPKGPR